MMDKDLARTAIIRPLSHEEGGDISLNFQTFQDVSVMENLLRRRLKKLKKLFILGW